MSDCLHCDINKLVQDYIDRGGGDIGEIAAKMTESLADLILLAPDDEQAKLMADVIASFGHVFLEKSGAIEADDAAPRH